MLFRVSIDEKALQELHDLKAHDRVMYNKLVASIDRLEQQGSRTPHMTKLVGTKNGWRIDAGRYRALLSLDDHEIIMWRVVMEKDTRKDYQHWIATLVQAGKLTRG